MHHNIILDKHLRQPGGGQGTKDRKIKKCRLLFIVFTLLIIAGGYDSQGTDEQDSNREKFASVGLWAKKKTRPRTGPGFSVVRTAFGGEPPRAA